jgi:DNA-binding response OmpR family regulator
VGEVMNNILIIEDEKSVSEILKAYLEKEGYGVYSTENGLDGIELFRRVGSGKDSIISIDDNRMTIDSDKRVVKINEEEVNLTPNEFDILYALASNRGKVFTREAIIERVFGIDFDGSDRIVDVHIKNLRKKIEDDSRVPKYIITITKVGYKFGEEK